MNGYSYLSNTDPIALEKLYQKYKTEPHSLDISWQRFFEGFDLAYGNMAITQTGISDDMFKEINVLRLINEGYRTRGHLFTKTNPVRERRNFSPTLGIENFGLTSADLDKTFNAGVEIGIAPAKLKDIIAHLETTYCQSIGVEFMYISNPDKKEWLRKRMEETKNTPQLSIPQKRLVLDKLNQATIFENFLHTKYVGQKRFSLEGLETLIPALEAVIEFGSELGVEEFVIGMAHRGRLNVLANILNKSYEEIFAEFEGKAFQNAIFEGDVKYHMGYSSNIKTSKHKLVRLTLCPNPSHLESVNPVVQGVAHAKFVNKYHNNRDKIAPIMIHGDASVAGQGIVYEVLQMSGLEAYEVGGSVHIVTNNQIGFTTNFHDARTSIYCTDVAKTTKCPVFHVNGDDVEALVYVIKLAMEYRQTFKSDVFIDILGYRRYGHNEGDEPRFTQPLLYKTIAKHPNPREIYAKKLLDHGSVEAALARKMEEQFKTLLQGKLNDVRSEKVFESKDLPMRNWAGFRKATSSDFRESPVTAVPANTFESLAERISTLPQDYLPIKKVQKIFKDRQQMIKSKSYDWAMAELMAYATLVNEGFHVRMSGQDCERGTFSHRHAVVKKEATELEYIPLQHVSDHQGRFEIYNSLLSEFAVLGFEYGYAMTSPKTLTIWEAQFGDFANGAQIIIDQYIAAGEAKWKRFNGLTLFLPHGYEGQGPEHSSARPERFLQLCANNNMQVVNCSTPANLFHVLRRQMHRNFRVPLIVMTPKSLLRHPRCVSSLTDFTKGGFNEMIDDTSADASGIERVLLCTGKIYYEVLNRQETLKTEKVAVVRLEQLYPLPFKQIEMLAKKYKNANWVFIQEEPKNMGTWLHLLRYDLPIKPTLISRNSSASPATGFAHVHKAEQEEILRKAFDLTIAN
jgi:2-oxoglutarate dehydrogenase E1 component